MSAPIDTTRLRALLDAASDPPEWRAAVLGGCMRVLDADGGIVATVSEESDAALIAAMHNDLRALLDEVEGLRALVTHPDITRVIDAVQHLANEVYLRGETEYAEILDTAADRLLVASGNHNTIPNADDEPEEGGTR